MIWIIGAGNIAAEYDKVLTSLGTEFITIGRGEESAVKYEGQTGHSVVRGGLKSFLVSKPGMPDGTIVAVPTTLLASTCIELMNYGVRRIFCEKPGFCKPEELDEVYKLSKQTNTEIFYAYNRRFYASVLKAEDIIKEDGGLASFNFEFTEWGHVIAATGHPKEVKENWMYANSTHVIDLAFFIGGDPIEWNAYAKDELDWHKPVNFSGAGITKKGVLFNYQANWNAPGRWAVELLTPLHRIYLKPMESLQLQDKGSVKVYPVEIDDRLDKEYKPGFYLETKAFLENHASRLCSIDEQIRHTVCIYNKIMGK